MPVFSDEKGQALLFENFIVQRIFYFPSAVGKTGKPHERIHGQALKKNCPMASRFRRCGASAAKAMTGRGNNDTSVQSQSEREKTVAGNEGGPVRTTGW
mgnify:CR=1 FL=1